MSDDQTVRERVVDVSRYVKNGALEGFTFLRCQINGPAVFVLADKSTIQNCQWDGDLDAILWEIPVTRVKVLGAVALRNCTFDDCRFTNIGLAGPPEAIAQIRAGFRQ